MQVHELQAEIITNGEETKVRYLILLEFYSFRHYVEIDEAEFMDLCSDLKDHFLLKSKAKSVLNENITKVKYFVK